MKRSPLVIFYLVVLFLFICSTPHANEKTLRVVFAQDFMPFSWKDNNEKIQGVLIDFLNEIMSKHMEINLRFEVYPWARAQHMVKKGERDAIFTIPNEERRTYSEVSEVPFFSSDFIMFTGSANPKYDKLKMVTTLGELKNNESFRHIYILGGGWHIKNLEGVKHVKRVTNSTMILNFLAQNIADVYIEQALLVNFQIKQLNYQNKIIEIPVVMDSTDWHLCIGKQSSFISIMPELNTLMKQMKKNGSLERIQVEIFNKYKSLTP